MLIGMGRTCVFVRHGDKDAFLKGNIEPDPDELDMVFDSSPSYAELLQQVRKDLNWMDLWGPRLISRDHRMHVYSDPRDQCSLNTQKLNNKSLTSIHILLHKL